ncbi:outer membrane protein assembly factor BamB [Halioglobus japonicus]|uniref:Outer membrane protein assembly factor BamB n=1 Tax=Halioglobus japonicus TaxID=930805 RepID=A0AAP8MG54_9GAMM|nr:MULTISPECIES: outer membrane protein assembly factor BamB [Halioglobus]AQA19669.1 outer membrane protein assembly factor BamB [Halioglobus japonicus]KZX59387.1 outer membrane protein assembly factor BamB [Halioglobus sp. HI00S01]PLW87263.1 outer membrane protein assembly factor BamB [Halioglobus japonicus]GHD09344.1 outer membrane protein assembly factor BamB [Halioglobus japonicus]
MQTRTRWLAAVLMSVALSGCSTVTGWFESDDDDPREPAELFDIEQSVKIKKLWSVGVGNGQGKGLYKLQPVIDGDTIYAASANGEVKAISRERGKQVWKTDLEMALSGGVGVSGDALLLGSSDGSVLKLDASNGDLLWSTRLQGEVLAPPQGNGRVVVAQTYDGKLQGLDFATGERLWTYDSNVPVLTIRGTSTPILYNNTVYAGFANGRVLAFDAQTGAIDWEVRVAISQGRSEIERIVDVDGTMALVGSELYAASYQGRVVAIDAASGRKIWQKDVSSFSGVSQGFGNVYVTDDDGTMSAYLRNGQGLRWQQDALSFRELSRPTPVSSYVAVTDFEGVLHLVSQVDGEFVGRTKVGGDGARADMLADGNLLYVYTNDGKLIAYEVSAKN